MENDMLVWTSVVWFRCCLVPVFGWFWFSSWFLVTHTAGFEL
jgi:hypothetical protein